MRIDPDVLHSRINPTADTYFVAKTEEERTAFLNAADELGLRWRSGNRPNAMQGNDYQLQYDRYDYIVYDIDAGYPEDKSFGKCRHIPRYAVYLSDLLEPACVIDPDELFSPKPACEAGFKIDFSRFFRKEAGPCFLPAIPS